jgi:iron-sulfur cluster insertion protein
METSSAGSERPVDRLVPGGEGEVSAILERIGAVHSRVPISRSSKEEPMVTLTETAAKKITDLRLEEGKPEWGLRIRLVGGGCSGMSYELGWEDTAGQDDDVIESQGVKVYVDRRSAPYITGSEIDYVDNNMMGAGFAIKNPNVKSSCGCGSSHQF